MQQCYARQDYTHCANSMDINKCVIEPRKKGVNADMEDSNDKRPARATADVTDINDDVCDTTSEGTRITFLGKEPLHPYKLKMTWERQMK